MKTIRIISITAGLMLACFAGCGGDGRPKLHQVEGTVTLNGEPLADAMVSFKPAADNPIQRPSSAMTDAQGKFVLRTYGENDGAPEGTYQVAIQKREVVGDLPANYDPEEPEAVPIRYRWITPRSTANPATSGLQAEIKGGALTPAVFELTGEPEVEIIGGGYGEP